MLRHACRRSERAARRGKTPAHPGGFTLIELMVVIVILGALVALVGPNVWSVHAYGTRKAAEMQIDNFKQAIEMYRLDARSLPSALQDLVQPGKKSGQPYLSEGRVPEDPWGRAFEYRVVNVATGEYAIASAGEDKQMGTADDVSYDSIGGFK